MCDRKKQRNMGAGLCVRLLCAYDQDVFGNGGAKPIDGPE